MFGVHFAENVNGFLLKCITFNVMFLFCISFYVHLNPKVCHPIKNYALNIHTFYEIFFCEVAVKK